MESARIRHWDHRGAPRGLGRLLNVFTEGCGLILLAAEVAVVALSPSSYRGAGANVLWHVHRAAGAGLAGFLVLMVLLNLVLIHILVVTADSFGLASLALDAVVRVLVLELIPLIAALYVTINYAVPGVSELQRRRWEPTMRARYLSRHEVVPRVCGAGVAVLLFAGLSCVISLVLAYLTIYGATWAGFAPYSHIVGNIFNPSVALIFTLKTLLFAGTVALLPVAYALRSPLQAGASIEVRGLLRVAVLMLLIEILSLVGNYY